MRCGQSWRPNDTKRFTLRSRGDGLGRAMYDTNPDLNRPWTLPSGMRVQVGKGRTHRTHHLCWYKGVFFCRRCGHYGQENHRILKLVEPCYAQVRDHHNIRRMKRLEGGKSRKVSRDGPGPTISQGRGSKVSCNRNCKRVRRIARCHQCTSHGLHWTKGTIGMTSCL